MCLLLALSVCLAADAPVTTDDGAPSAHVSQTIVDRDVGWRADLDFFVAEARRVHADPERPAFSERFETAAKELRAAIPDLSDDQVLARMMRLAAILNDGHTAFYGPSPDSPLSFERRVLPFKFYWFPSGLYIVGGAGECVDFAGSRVVRFGALTAEEVLQRMSAYRGVDNDMTWKWMGPQFYVRSLGLLREVGVTVDEGIVDVSLVTLDGEERTLAWDPRCLGAAGSGA